MKTNFNQHKIIRKPGIIIGQISTSIDCCDPNDKIIETIEESDILPPLNDDKSQTQMIDKKFVEKWRGIIKDVDINNLRESKLNKK